MINTLVLTPGMEFGILRAVALVEIEQFRSFQTLQRPPNVGWCHISVVSEHHHAELMVVRDEAAGVIRFHDAADPEAIIEVRERPDLAV